MDPLSDVLSLLRPRSYVSSGFDAGEPWSVRFAEHHGFIKCNVVVSGGCWLAVDGVPAAVRLESGDCFVLPSGRPFRMASGLDLPSAPADEVFPPPRIGGVATHNGGGSFFLVGSRFSLEGGHAGILLGMLPPIVRIRQKSEQHALRWSMERMRLELREGRPGNFLVAEHLAHMMLIQALRLHLENAGNGGVGWLYALADERMGAAIGAMHETPAHRWTVEELARRVGMSRSTFALRFKEKVGTAPMEYLARWRMLLAGDRLAHSVDSIADIAFSLGYESESAFSTAFKRVMGASPRRYARGRNPVRR